MMMKRIYTIIAASVFSFVQAQNAPETADTVAEIEISDELFVLESNPIAEELDSLMKLHIFTYRPDSLPENYDSTFVPTFSDSIVKMRMAALDASTPLHLDYNPVVKRFIELYTERRREQVGRMLSLSEYYFPMFEEVLDRYNMPIELKYLAVVESALNPKARSRVGATGLWQFMYGTGKIMGLKTSSYVDERSDPYKSTVAACEYMQRMYKMFGDWNLVLAAYNSGPGNVNKAIRRSGGKTSYWELRPYLPRETAGYVPAFIAATYAMNYAKEYNLYPTQTVPIYAETDTILIKQKVSFDQLSLWLGFDKESIEFLNPSYKIGVIPVIPEQAHFLVLPHDIMGLFVENEDSLYAFAANEWAEKKDEMPETPSAEDRIVHRVKSGENLGLIANKYGVSVSKIKSWNGLRSTVIRPGQRLIIYSNRPAPSRTKTAKVEEKNGNFYYTVQSGDTLYDIAKKFPGVSSQNIADWNDINAHKITPGMKLVVKKTTTSQ